jgi:hypothetical protein
MRRILTATGFLASLFCLSGSAFADSVLFTSGPYNGTVDSWDLTGAQYVANNFTVGYQAITSASFVIWADPGDSITTVDWQILTSPGGTVLASGTAGVTQSLLTTPSIFGYDIDSETFAIPAFVPGAGTYWLQLGNTQGSANPVYWDENDNPNSIPGLSGWDSVVSGGYLTPGNDPADCPTVACTETFSISGTTPEPGSFTLLAVGLAGMLMLAAGLKITRRTSR